MNFPVAQYYLHPLRRLSLGLACGIVSIHVLAGWSLRPAVQVDATGIYLDQLVASAEADVPHLRLAPAPGGGRILTLNGAQINELLLPSAPELVTTNWSGAPLVRISRRMRPITEAEIKDLLTAALQENYVKDRGELELRFTRPVAPINIIDEPLTVKMLELPTTGVSPNFIARFELRAGTEVAGTWQVPAQAQIWREVYVAAAPLRRGTLLRDAEISRERRDVLTLRDPVVDLDLNNPAFEIAEQVPAGLALSSRSLRLRAVIHRGKVAEAIIQDGLLTVSVKVEVLEDGQPGQTIRVRNLKSKREFRGKVANEETIHVML